MSHTPSRGRGAIRPPPLVRVLSPPAAASTAPASPQPRPIRHDLAGSRVSGRAAQPARVDLAALGREPVHQPSPMGEWRVATSGHQGAWKPCGWPPTWWAAEPHRQAGVIFPELGDSLGQALL